MVPKDFPVSLFLPRWHFPLKDALLNRGYTGQWKRNFFWRGKCKEKFCISQYVLVFIFFSVALYFSSKQEETSSNCFLWCNSRSSNLLFFYTCYIQGSGFDIFLKYEKTIFLSKASRIIRGCPTGPRRFCFVLESAAVSYNDFVWPALLWRAGAGKNLSSSHQNIPLWPSALLLSLKYLVSVLTRGETDVHHH